MKSRGNTTLYKMRMDHMIASAIPSCKPVSLG